MKALSLSQPWLFAVLDELAGKGIENRKWPPPIAMIGETIALHAAKSFDDDALPKLWSLGIKTPDMYSKSVIAGVATIDRVVTEGRTLPENQKTWYMGPYYPDGKVCYGWVLTNRRKLPRPIPCNGALGLWRVPPTIEAEIHNQLGGSP